MALQPAICKECGGRIKVDDIDLNGFGECEYCHTPYRVIDVITIDGLPTAKSLLLNADMCVDDGNADRAISLYKEVLLIKPNCHEAWWGLYLCNRYVDRYYQYKDKYGNSGPHTKASIMAETINKYAMRAIEYAPAETAEEYRETIKPEVDFIDMVRRGGMDKKSSGGQVGCYIATAVYGSYTCPQVVTLRRYRDDYLANRFWGRWFIRGYYAISPTLAKHIQSDSLVGKTIRRWLDKKVERLSM